MINECLLCHNKFVHELTPAEIFGIDKICRDYLCSKCQSEFEYINKGCPTCCHPDRIRDCIDCDYWHEKGYSNFKHQALCRYNLAMHDYFKQYKRYGDRALCYVFQNKLHKKLSRKDTYVYIPSSQEHLTRRRFDPVVELYGEIVNLTPALIKLPTKESQAQKNRNDRLKSPQFLKFDFAYKDILNKNKIVILDDVYTTGRTIFHATDCLREAGFTGQITSFSLAR